MIVTPSVLDKFASGVFWRSSIAASAAVAFPKKTSVVTETLAGDIKRMAMSEDVVKKARIAWTKAAESNASTVPAIVMSSLTTV